MLSESWWNIVFAIFKKRAKMIFCHKAFTFVAFKKKGYS